MSDLNPIGKMREKLMIVKDSNGQVLNIGDTICTPGKDGFDFPMEFILANKCGEIKAIEEDMDCVVVELKFQSLKFNHGSIKAEELQKRTGLYRFRGFELTKI